MRRGTFVGRGQSDRAQSQLRTSGSSPRQRRRVAREALSRACQPVLAVEALETRTLLSTLPLPIISSHTDLSGGGDGVNQSSPSIAYNPQNARKLVTIYTSHFHD